MAAVSTTPPFYVRFPSAADLAARVAAVTACSSVDAFASALQLHGAPTLAAALARASDAHAPTGAVGFVARLLPSIAARAARLHVLFPDGLRALTEPGQLLALTREQGGALLACMFIDAFPGGERTHPPADHLCFSFASFRSLFAETRAPGHVSILQLILHAFERQLLLGAPRGSLYFRRLAAAPEVVRDADAFFRACTAPAA